MMTRARPCVCPVLDSIWAVPPDLCNTVQTCRCVALTLHMRFTTVLTVIALSVLAMSIAVVVRKSLAGGGPELGCVSERWLAEHRADASRPSRY